MKKFFEWFLALLIVLIMLPAILVLMAGLALEDEKLSIPAKLIVLILGCVNAAAIWWVILN